MRTAQKFVFICSGKDCKKAGAKKLMNNLPKTLKDKNARSKVRVIKTKCLDYCKKGPNMVYDNRIYNRADENLLNDVIAECFRDGK